MIHLMTILMIIINYNDTRNDINSLQICRAIICSFNIMIFDDTPNDTPNDNHNGTPNDNRNDNRSDNTNRYFPRIEAFEYWTNIIYSDSYEQLGIKRWKKRAFHF